MSSLKRKLNFEKTPESKKSKKSGKVRVGWYDSKNQKSAEWTGFETTLVHTTGSLSPFVFKVVDDTGMNDENNDKAIFENYWQGTKVYRHVNAIRQTVSRFTKKIRFEYKEADLCIEDNGEFILLSEYANWSNAVKFNPLWIRYPVGTSKSARSQCIGSIYYHEGSHYLLKYEDGRKLIYFKKLYEGIIDTKAYKELEQKINNGINVQITEVDAPKLSTTCPKSCPHHQVELDQQKYPSTEITKELFFKFLKCTNQPFGHGICIAGMLLGITPDDLIKDIDWDKMTKIKVQF